MFLDELPDSVTRQVSFRSLAQGELLFHQGDRVSAIFEVVSGRLRLVRRTVDDHLVAIHTARPGDLCAEAALFSDIYHCDAVAAVPSRICIYPKRPLLAALRKNPSLFEAFAARLAHQLQDLRARLELRNIRSARKRLLQYLPLSATGDGRTVAMKVICRIWRRTSAYRARPSIEPWPPWEMEGAIERSAAGIVLKKSLTA
jgi:CRP-like cAMP-binding protein